MQHAIVPGQSNRLFGHGPEYDDLIRRATANGVKMTIENVLRIWEITDRAGFPGLQHSIIWIEEGNDKAGYQHMLKHKEEFLALGVPEEKLLEVAEAATTIGHYGGLQGRKPGRPIFGLFFNGKPLAVAISVGSNGFVVGMNRSNLDNFLANARLSTDDLEELHSWWSKPEPDSPPGN